jgi:molybdopterin/thiamine biosynthesis adenylyltransferase
VKAEAFGVRVDENNVATLCGSADLVVDAFDNAKSRRLLSAWAKSASKPLVHAAVSADGTFGLVRWDERFVADEEPSAGDPGAPDAATCEGGEHLPLIAVVASTLARTVQDFVAHGRRRDAMISLSGVTTTAE